jgi:phosphomannomutase
MPEVSRFFGISIRMYFDDHDPPHFHAIYGDAEVEMGIAPVALLRGRFPRRALGMVMEWAAMHQQELVENWELLRSDQTPNKIEPLD